MLWDEALRTKRALGEGQYLTLCAVRQIGLDGWPVSVREIAVERGRTSTSPIYYQLQHLENLGLVESSKRHRYGWRITEDGRAVLNS